MESMAYSPVHDSHATLSYVKSLHMLADSPVPIFTTFLNKQILLCEIFVQVASIDIARKFVVHEAEWQTFKFHFLKIIPRLCLYQIDSMKDI